MPSTFDRETLEGRRPADDEDPLVGAMLDDRYVVEARIATGGFGAIYRARTAGGAAIALKVLHPRLTGDPTMVARFRREGAILTQLHDPHTVATLAVGETRDGILYIAMELLSGETLHDHLQRAGALPWQTAVAIARAVCSSLAEAHALGVVHRDLKPANIHIESRGPGVQAIKVIDFGIVKIARGSAIDDGDDLTCAGHMIGTYEYMSPEQLLGGSCGPASDLYSLGVVLYEMLTGRRPFPELVSPASLATAIVTETVMPPSALAATPPELDRIAMRCLERDDGARFANVVELAHELDRLLAVRVAPHDEITTICPPRSTIRDDRSWSEHDDDRGDPNALDPSPLSPWTLPMVGSFGDATVTPPGITAVPGPDTTSAPAPRFALARLQHGTLPGVGAPSSERRSAPTLADPGPLDRLSLEAPALPPAPSTPPHVPSTARLYPPAGIASTPFQSSPAFERPSPRLPAMPGGYQSPLPSTPLGRLPPLSPSSPLDPWILPQSRRERPSIPAAPLTRGRSLVWRIAIVVAVVASIAALWTVLRLAG